MKGQRSSGAIAHNFLFVEENREYEENFEEEKKKPRYSINNADI